MAVFGLKMKRQRGKASATYHIDTPAKHGKKKIGLSRSLGSAVSLIIGGFMFYIALHYIPAYLGFQKVVAMSDLDTSASRLAKDDPVSLLSAYLDPFRLKRTYLRAGQTIQVQYVLPEGTELKIYINRCRSAFIVEIFQCDVVSQEKAIVKNDKVGTQHFQFQEAGFYLFDEVVDQGNTPERNYRVVWSRV